MLRVVLGVATILLAGVLSVGSAAAKEAKTIRIEPRAWQGATISLEAGVRVYRPLPRTTHVIVNPNKTPVNLTIKDVNKRITNTNIFRSDGGISGGSVFGLPFNSSFGNSNFRRRGIGNRRFGRNGLGARRFTRGGNGRVFGRSSGGRRGGRVGRGRSGGLGAGR